MELKNQEFGCEILLSFLIHSISVPQEWHFSWLIFFVSGVLHLGQHGAEISLALA